MLQVEHLNKSFARFRLEDISFTLPKGYIMGLIGENGSGKSTLIRCIMNIYKKDQGKVHFISDKSTDSGDTTGLTGLTGPTGLTGLTDSIDLDEDEAEFKKRIAVVLDQAMYEADMSCMDNARIVAVLNQNFQMEQFLKECKDWNLNPKKKLSSLSKGTQMKFQIAMAMAQNPELLIMDEPSANLDEMSRKIFRERMIEFINDGTRSILISSHLTKDLDNMADYILYLHKGKVLMNEDKEHLLDDYLLVSGEHYKIRLIPDKLIIGMEKQELSTTALIRKSNSYVPDLSLTVSRPRLEDLMYYVNHKEKSEECFAGTLDFSAFHHHKNGE